MNLDYSSMKPLHSLSPTIHWAKKHHVSPNMKWARRIYDYELLYVQHGEIEVYMYEKKYRLTSGQLIYFPAGVYHTVKVLTNPYATFLGIHFDYFNELDVKSDHDIIVKENDIVEKRFCLEPHFEDTQQFLRQPFTPHSKVISLMGSLIDEFTEQKRGYLISCKGILLQLISLLLRTYDNNQDEVSEANQKNISFLIQIIEENYNEDWSNQQLSKIVNLNEDYMTRLFKRVTGTTPNKFLQDIRHKKAKQFLRETDLSIEEIGEKIGYSNIHYFSRLFKKWEGISPLSYRKLSKML
ncbi:helix-turn-helix transcriptional regulator [Cytobacillus oceanisediminis]|uniref:AraC family transcriptional regulator n=1 Tax=Cytobacillus oceanisediminis TaxID=665099 RepID=UPI001CCD3AD5|nr:helix-turn-helix domain-containing protein [Cytobacillus oceanisediminis]MBZ9536733.1 helix-turn-helix transcriptional regulator [Cytobacillus oceanisediminis]